MQIKNRQQLLGLVAIAAIAIFAADKLVISPLGHLWKVRTNRLSDLRQQVRDGTQLLRREQSLRARWDYMRTNTLPNNAAAAEQKLLNAFDRWSQDTRVSIASINPQWKHDTDDYMTLQCRVEASGNINTVTRFLYEIEKDPMALRMDAVEISARDNEGQQINLGLQVSGLVLTAQESRQ